MRVLILGGGGTLGAFSAGAIAALDASGYRADAFIGSSAGGINLLRYLTQGGGAACAFWESLHWLKLLADNFRSPSDGALLAAKRFIERVEQGVDFDALYHDKRTIGFIVVDLGTGKVSVRSNRKEPHAHAFRQMARASYALPPLLPPIEHNGRFYADGGLLQNAPLDYAVQRLHATEITYLCNVEALPHERKSHYNVATAVVRYADIFFRRASNVGFADAEILEGRYRSVPFRCIAPPSSLELTSALAWMLPSPRNMRRVVAHGEEAARKLLAHESIERTVP